RHHTQNARQPANSTNQKTIGINKLGTLLSSQTTGTYDYLRDIPFPASIRFPSPLCSQLISFSFPLSNPSLWLIACKYGYDLAIP
ncbi:hypothetical protein, partial [Arthrobacter sp. Leaf234]|uniref:hypothetical protein n=1 Tax=Arthrobacter sp. Leaf234 TaxID=1736303 RepID=UPI001F22128B